jgi:parallel beta-helix repeat protein
MKTPSLPQLVKGAFIALIAFTLARTAAQAQSRTWVSGTGSDSNPCTEALPCRTFFGAYNKTAANGEISARDAGEFGNLQISKNITISGDGTLASVLISGIGINIVGAGIKVNLRNLSLQGAGTVGALGIWIQNASEVNIENCTIDRMGGHGITINPSTACGVTIKNTTFRGCGQGAVYVIPNAATGVAVNISRSSMNDCLYAFRAENNVKAVLDDCVIAGSTNNAVVVQPASAASKVILSRCTINDSGGYGVLANGALATVFISNNVIFNNGVGVGVLAGGVITSLGNNNINGNATDGSPKP